MIDRMLLGIFCVLQVSGAAPAAALSFKARIAKVEQALLQWRVAEAEKALEPLARAAPNHPRILYLRGEILFLDGKYDEALKVLRAVVKKKRSSLQLKAQRDLVVATAAVVASYKEHRSEGGHFRIFTSKGRDELLAPFAAETLEGIRAAMKQDLGHAPADPIRVEIYPSPEDLARVSPLTLREINRSGTIALCKYNRLMIVSPRALLRGYAWRDALAHEYVHLVVSRLSHNEVPIWLHEGLAKLLDTRWREPPEAEPPLSPAQEHLLAQALRTGKLIRWEQMHPSIAKLPSQQAAALAFAQVQTAVHFLVKRINRSGLQRLIESIRRGQSCWEALRQTAGMSRGQFLSAWRKYLAGLGLRSLPDLVQPKLRFGKQKSKEKRIAAIKEKRARRFLRLADLLRSRQLTRAAIIEYEKARKILGQRDDLVANHLARSYLEISSPAQAISALMPVLEYYPELPGPQVTMGIAHLRNGDPARAVKHLKVALRINPFNPELHCSLAQALKNLSAKEAHRHAELCNVLR